MRRWRSPWRALFDLHPGCHRHARAEHITVVGRVVEDDLHRDALDDLHVIAGGVLRREQAERGAGAGLEAVDVPFEILVGVGVDLDRKSVV